MVYIVYNIYYSIPYCSYSYGIVIQVYYMILELD